jgi:hypothetical protein
VRGRFGPERKPPLRNYLVLILCVGLSLALSACGGSSGKSDSETKATTTATSTRSTKTSDNPPTTTTASKLKLGKLSDSEREDARNTLRPVASCLREADIKVNTDPGSAKHDLLSNPGFIAVRAEWKGGGADVAVTASKKDAKRVDKALGEKKSLILRQGSVVVVFDKTPAETELKRFENCVG